jgi:hypothetical protein
MSQCYIVTRSFFYAIVNTATSGMAPNSRGAIYLLGTGSVYAIVNVSTFISCASLYGGGVAFGCPSASVDRCCGTNCSSNTLGHFLQFGAEAAADWQSDVSFVTVLLCAPPQRGEQGQGTVNVHQRRFLNCTNTNFSVCRSDEGSAVRVANTSAQSTSRYLTVILCEGKTGIDSIASVSVLVELCNVYNNSLDDGSLYARQNGMTIKSCVFSHNSRDIGAASCGSEPTIVVVACSFTMSQSSATTLCWSASGNAFSVQASSLPLSLLDARSCTYTPTAGFDASARVGASARVHASARFASVPLRPTSVLSPSRAFPQALRRLPLPSLAQAASRRRARTIAPAKSPAGTAPEV